jgi:D-3-phosphoglycerate dehydrogenase / 2-oxoglutarate reductase
MIAVLLETIDQSAYDILIGHNIEVIHAYDYSDINTIDKSKIDIIITRGKGLVRKELIDECSALKVIARCGIGLENIDVNYAKGKDIAVLNAPGSNTQTTAEHTLSLMMMLVRNLYQPVEATKSLDLHYRNTYKGDELYGKNLGIIGLGNIGGKVAKMSKAFGLNIAYHNRSEIDSVDIQYMPLSDLLQWADIVSLHIPLTSDTKAMVDKDFLAQMKNGSYLINTSRHEMIDIDDVITALDSGKLIGYAADCPMRIESASFTSLIKHPRAIISPHIASLTATTYKAMCEITIQKVIDAIK